MKRATSLAALLLVVLCVVLTVRHPALFAVMTNGDQLTIPSLVDDFLHNPHFSLSTWSLPRAPYFFPDGALVLLLRLATPDTVRLLALYAGLHALGLIAATGLVIRRALPEGGARSIALVFALIGFALVLTLSYEPWYWPILSLPFLPISHAGPMICGLALAAVFLGIRRGAVGWLVLTVASAALVLSDRFFIVYFIVPYLLVTVLTDRDPKRRESFKALGAEAGAANRALAAAFDGCTTQYGLKAGLADYWIARTITMATDWRVQVNQVQPHVPVSPFFWGNNALWFYLDARTGAPIAYNFVVTPPTGRAGVEDLYGTPSRYVTCGGYELAVYGDPVAMTAKVFDVIERYEPSAAELTAPIRRGIAGAP